VLPLIQETRRPLCSSAIESTVELAKENIMFDSLAEQMKHDDATTASPRQRLMKWAVIAVVAIAVFGALYLALQAIA
jgi:hypothetical protein